MKINIKINEQKKLYLEYFLLAAILVFALLLKLYYLFRTPQPELIYDAHNYDVMTKQFLDKGFLGYSSIKPNAFTTPGYPLFLAFLYKVFGYANGSPLAQVRVIQVLIATLTIGVLYFLSRHVANRKVAVITVFFSSIYLVSLWVPTLILTETLYTFLFILYLYLQILAINKRSGPLNFLTGVVFAAAVLVRPAIAPLIILPYFYYYLETKDKNLIKDFTANIAGFVLLMMPWWIRNIAVLRKLVLLATQEDPLLRGTYPYGIGEENISYTNQKQEAIHQLINGFTKQPFLYLKWYTIGKFDWLYFKVFYYVDDKVNTLRWLFPLHDIFVWFGWVGVALGAVRKEIRLISLYIIFITLIHLAFVATSRYAYPVMPLLMLLTAFILDSLFFRPKQAWVPDNR